MTDPLGETRAALAEVSERLRSAYRCAETAEQRLTEAIGMLTEMGRAHHESMVPAELLRADQELTRGLGLISGGVDSVAAVELRL